jgi:hypothetical protein
VYWWFGVRQKVPTKWKWNGVEWQKFARPLLLSQQREHKLQAAREKRKEKRHLEFSMLS